MRNLSSNKYKYKDHYLKIDKFKTKLKCKFIRNNLSINKLQEKDYKLSSTYRHGNTVVYYDILIFKSSMEQLFQYGSSKRVKIRGNKKCFSLCFLFDIDNHIDYMKKRYIDIPANMEYIRNYYKDNFYKCKIRLVLHKKEYANLMNYVDPTLPKTYNIKKERVIYSNIYLKPYSGGGFSPK